MSADTVERFIEAPLELLYDIVSDVTVRRNYCRRSNSGRGRGVRTIGDFHADAHRRGGQRTLFDLYRFHAFSPPPTRPPLLDTVGADRRHRQAAFAVKTKDAGDGG